MVSPRPPLGGMTRPGGACRGGRRRGGRPTQRRWRTGHGVPLGRRGSRSRWPGGSCRCRAGEEGRVLPSDEVQGAYVGDGRVQSGGVPDRGLVVPHQLGRNRAPVLGHQQPVPCDLVRRLPGTRSSPGKQHPRVRRRPSGAAALMVVPNWDVHGREPQVAVNPLPIHVHRPRGRARRRIHRPPLPHRVLSRVIERSHPPRDAITVAGICECARSSSWIARSNMFTADPFVYPWYRGVPGQRPTHRVREIPTVAITPIRVASARRDRRTSAQSSTLIALQRVAEGVRIDPSIGGQFSADADTTRCQ
jgi:hypothetical protein